MSTGDQTLNPPLDARTSRPANDEFAFPAAIWSVTDRFFVELDQRRWTGEPKANLAIATTGVNRGQQKCPRLDAFDRETCSCVNVHDLGPHPHDASMISEAPGCMGRKSISAADADRARTAFIDEFARDCSILCIIVIHYSFRMLDKFVSTGKSLTGLLSGQTLLSPPPAASINVNPRFARGIHQPDSEESDAMVTARFASSENDRSVRSATPTSS